MAISKINLEELKSIDFTKTALSDIKQELVDYIKNHPDYNTLWDNFYDSDSGKILIDTFAYLVRKLLIRIDLTANENFPTTAQQDSSVIKILKLLGYELRPNSQAAVYLNLEYPAGRPEVEINMGVDYSIPATSTTGESINFYVRNDATDYFNTVKIPQGLDNKAKRGLILRAYSGELRVDSIDRSDIITRDGEIYTLNESPIVQDSIRVFYYDESDVKKEAVRVNSFFEVPFDADYVPYIEHFDEFSGAYLEFGDIDLVKVLPDNKDLEAYYCIGGGVSHNIVENSINISDTFTLPTVIGGDVTINFNNPGKGFGGKDAETIDEAKVSAPLSLRTINRAVTEQDYEILLARQGSILHTKVLSPNDNVDYYPKGSKIPLFHVWIYVTLNRPIESMNDFLLSKQVDNVGKLIGGDVYDILEYLRTRRIVGIENVIKPSKYTRLFFSLNIEYNKYIEVNQVETDSRTALYDLYQLSKTGYGNLVRLNTIISHLKENVNGILDVTVSWFKIKKYAQIVDVVSSPYYFKFIDTEPEYIEIKNEITDLPANYQSDYDEVVFLLDADNDIALTFVSVDQ